MNKQNTNKKDLNALRKTGIHVFEVTVAVHAALALAEVQRPMQDKAESTG